MAATTQRAARYSNATHAQMVQRRLAECKRVQSQFDALCKNLKLPARDTSHEKWRRGASHCQMHTGLMRLFSSHTKPLTSYIYDETHTTRPHTHNTFACYRRAACRVSGPGRCVREYDCSRPPPAAAEKETAVGAAGKHCSIRGASKKDETPRAAAFLLRPASGRQPVAGAPVGHCRADHPRSPRQSQWFGGLPSALSPKGQVVPPQHQTTPAFCRVNGRCGNPVASRAAVSARAR